MRKHSHCQTLSRAKPRWQTEMGTARYFEIKSQHFTSDCRHARQPAPSLQRIFTHLCSQLCFFFFLPVDHFPTLASQERGTCQKQEAHRLTLAGYGGTSGGTSRRGETPQIHPSTKNVSVSKTLEQDHRRFFLPQN